MKDIRSVDIRRAALPPGARAPYGNNPVLLKCPQHQDDSNSLAVFCDHIKCFGCPFVIQKRMDALAWLLKLPDWRAALAVADQYMFLPQTQRQAERQNTAARPPTTVEIGIYERLLWGQCSHRLDWLSARGLSDATIRAARLGHNGAAFVIPVLDKDCKPVSLRYRNDDLYGTHEDVYADDDIEPTRRKKLSKYRGWAGCNDARLYPEWKFALDRRSVLAVCEGELDALLLWQHGTPAVTATNGAGQQGLVLSLIQDYYERSKRDRLRKPPIKQLYICGDRDAPGIEAARKTFEAAQGIFEAVSWLQWPLELGKDITEVFMKGYSFEHINVKYGVPFECAGAHAGEWTPDSKP